MSGAKAQATVWICRLNDKENFFLEPGARPSDYPLPQRAVAQLGRALEWGSRGREFESLRPDSFELVPLVSLLGHQGASPISAKKAGLHFQLRAMRGHAMADQGSGT